MRVTNWTTTHLITVERVAITSVRNVLRSLLLTALVVFPVDVTKEDCLTTPKIRQSRALSGTPYSELTRTRLSCPTPNLSTISSTCRLITASLQPREVQTLTCSYIVGPAVILMYVIIRSTPLLCIFRPTRSRSFRRITRQTMVYAHYTLHFVTDFRASIEHLCNCFANRLIKKSD